MKRRYKFLIVILSCILAMSIALFSGCGMFSSCCARHYYVTYSDKDIVHSGIDVKKGDKIFVNNNHIPYKDGYIFLGWFDKEEGGEMYIDAQGQGLKGIKKDLTLYQQYKAIDITVKLKYPEEYTGAKTETLVLKYDDKIDGLPLDLTLANCDFDGWYTQNAGHGKKIANASGMLAGVSAINYNEYNICEDELTLYANFTPKKYIVTLKFGDEHLDEEVRVEYGTPVAGINYKTRNADGFAVNGWSKSKGGENFSGKITGNTVLYASGKWSPIITFDNNGGSGAYSIVADENEDITLPIPEKITGEFNGWNDDKGNVAEFDKMPSESVKLTASWTPKIVLDENGGEKVNDIKAKAGASVSLPYITKNGYIFGGWFDEDGKKYETKTMPNEGALLKAGWYKAKQMTMTWKDAYADCETTYRGHESSIYEETNLEGIYYLILDISFECDHYSSKNSIIGFDGYNSLYFCIYSAATTDSNFALCDQDYFPHQKVSSYRKYNVKKTIKVTDGLFYMSFTASTRYSGVSIRNISANVTYPLIKSLYLDF